MAEISRRLKTVIVGAGPVGTLAALYAAVDGGDVELYELRSGKSYRRTDNRRTPEAGPDFLVLWLHCV